MPALPLHTAGKYVAGAYIVFFLLVLIYVAIMAVRLSRIERELGELLRLAEGSDVQGRSAGGQGRDVAEQGPGAAKRGRGAAEQGRGAAEQGRGVAEQGADELGVEHRESTVA